MEESYFNTDTCKIELQLKEESSVQMVDSAKASSKPTAFNGNQHSTCIFEIIQPFSYYKVILF